MIQGLGSDARLLKRGDRSRNPIFELTWTSSSTSAVPHPAPTAVFLLLYVIAHLMPAHKADPRLPRFANAFVYPPAQPPSRPRSFASVRSDVYTADSCIASGSSARGSEQDISDVESVLLEVGEQDRERLRDALVGWRESQQLPCEVFSLLHCISHPSSLIGLSKLLKPLLQCYLELSMPTSFES